MAPPLLLEQTLHGPRPCKCTRLHAQRALPCSPCLAATEALTKCARSLEEGLPEQAEALYYDALDIFDMESKDAQASETFRFLIAFLVKSEKWADAVEAQMRFGASCERAQTRHSQMKCYVGERGKGAAGSCVVRPPPCPCVACCGQTRRPLWLVGAGQHCLIRTRRPQHLWPLGCCRLCSPTRHSTSDRCRCALNGGAAGAVVTWLYAGDAKMAWQTYQDAMEVEVFGSSQEAYAVDALFEAYG